MNNVNDLQEQFENLIKQGQELLEKMKENQNADVSKKVRWKPKVGDVYYYITTTGGIDYFKWVGTSGSSTDDRLYEINNCFQTMEEAQKELDRRIAERELLDMCDWESDSVYFIVFNKDIDTFDTDSYNTFIPTPYRFATYESCQKAIDTLGEEKLKLIFRID